MDVDEYEHTGGGEEPFLMPENTITDLIKDIEMSIKCNNNVSGGKTIRKRRINKKKKKRKTRKTYKQKKHNY